ncbi:MAG: hypothetical protein KBD78_05305 [Oligoflexales bacterium]|nr:hypothetical protein [Oligoflexales bacterium]
MEYRKIRLLNLFLIICFLLSYSCSYSNKQSGESVDTDRIKRAGTELTAVAPEQDLSLTDLNAATLQVNLRKDSTSYKPKDPGAVNSTILPACFSAFDPEEVLGVVSCELDKKKVVDLKAKNVLQVCSYNKNIQIKPSEKLAIDCGGKLKIEKYSFEPVLDIRID